MFLLDYVTLIFNYTVHVDRPMPRGVIENMTVELVDGPVEVKAIQANNNV